MYTTYLNIIYIIYSYMVSITLSVPEEMKEEMEKFPEINWSEVARQSIDKKLEELQFLEEFKKYSDLSEEEAIELGKTLNEKLIDHYEESVVDETSS